MFDIMPDEISQLDDGDLRELVGRLCEAELVSRGLSPAAVTWGGSQTAADGGLDVRVDLPSDIRIDGFIPRPLTGFQVKKPDMPRAEIISEMRPTGVIRPIIQHLAHEAGAYVIVSSTGSTTDSALSNRQNALREALGGVRKANQLHTDFYDRTRLATWVRCHPGLITWVKAKLGRATVGWRPYGPWCGVAGDSDAEYLVDDQLRLHLGVRRDTRAQSVVEGIDELRRELAEPGKIMRLIGLSGVGKTRLAQALFDSRVGSHPLPPSLAVYTNLSDNPDPQPIGLASDLIANRMRAILIVDNCSPDLHRRLSELCSGQASTISVLTIEYDVRDDQPEGTQVVTLDTSSTDLIEKLVQRRYPHVSQVDARMIAAASGGNARVAIALAETVGRSDTISGLSDDELFQRLFRQRHDPNNALLLAASACSLVYSFQGEALDGEDAELPRLAALAGQTPAETFRHVGELLRRELVQPRGVWRAVLPHAVANRLAARALEDTPYDLISQHLVEGGTPRLARSFSRRLSFLSDHPRAVAIVERWFAPGGLLFDVTSLNDLGQAMFENVAPVLPEVALAALERAGHRHSDIATRVWRRHRSLLRSLAYDPLLFERSAQVLVRAVLQSSEDREIKEASDAFASLFTIYLSGTHATVNQRLDVIEALLRSPEAKARALGLASLDSMLEAEHFTSGRSFEFGSRSRDFGYAPRTHVEVVRWYGSALGLIERLALPEGAFGSELRDLVARKFRGLWTLAGMHDELERLSHGFASDGFWREGWAACRETIYFDRGRLPPEVASRLFRLESDLSPANLPDRVRAMVLGGRSGGLDLEDMDVDGDPTSAFERLDNLACELGAEIAADDSALTELLPDLLRGGNRVWVFGRGLAAASTNPRAHWARLVDGLEATTPEARDVQLLRGFLSGLWETDNDLAQHLLDSAVDQSALQAFLPALHSAVELDERGVERLKRVLGAGQSPVWNYRNLAFGRATDRLSGQVLKDLLVLIASQPDGCDVALEILSMRLFSDCSAQREHETGLHEAGRELLRRATFRRNNHRSDHEMASVVRACLTGQDAAAVAMEVAARLRQAVAAHAIHALDYQDLLEALLEVQPLAVLDALLEGSEAGHLQGASVFDEFGRHRGNPADVVSCEALIAWCDANRERRYPLAASIITFARRGDASGPWAWSEQATAILVGAPDLKRVLEVFIRRFRPMQWSGSRAALMEANARLLDCLDPYVPSDLMPFVTKTKSQLAQEIARERQRESERDRARDERFEW